MGRHTFQKVARTPAPPPAPLPKRGPGKRIWPHTSFKNGIPPHPRRPPPSAPWESAYGLTHPSEGPRDHKNPNRLAEIYLVVFLLLNMAFSCQRCSGALKASTVSNHSLMHSVPCYMPQQPGTDLDEPINHWVSIRFGHLNSLFRRS